MTPPPPDPQPSAPRPQVGRYTILGKLGKGAMGVVYLAEDPVLHRQVAVKTIDLAIDDPQQRSFLRDRLLRDARAAAALTHPNVVAVYDVLVEQETAYLVLEYVAGETLWQRLAANPSLDNAFLACVLRGMAAALDYAHTRGVVHRDVKPANVMLDTQGNVKIMDFGIARLNDGSTVTAAGTVMGTVEYMAPEQIKGETVDGRADQFSLAAVAYEMLTGSTLFGRHSFTTLAYKLVNEAPPPSRSRRPDLPEAVDRALMRALSKQPADRFATCNEFVEALIRGLDAKPAGAPAATETIVLPVQAPPPPAPRRSAAVWALPAVLLVAAGAAALVWKPWARSQPLTLPPPPSPNFVIADPPPPPPTRTPREPAAKKSPPPAPPDADVASRDDTPTETDIPPEALGARQQALEMFHQRRFAEAAAILDNVLKQHPKMSWAYVMRGQLKCNQDDFQPALKDFAEALRLTPRHPNAYLHRGFCYVRMKNDQAALSDLSQSILLHPEAPNGLDARGMIYYRAEKYDKALADLNQAIQLQPGTATFYQHRGTVKRAGGDQAGARADFARSRELGDTNAGARKDQQ